MWQIFFRHVVRHRQYETEVQKKLALNVGNRRRKDLFNKLRNEGSFLKSYIEETVVPVKGFTRSKHSTGM